MLAPPIPMIAGTLVPLLPDIEAEKVMDLPPSEALIVILPPE